MATTPIWNLPLPTDGQTPWGGDYRTALGIIDANGFQSRGSMFLEDGNVPTTVVEAGTFVKASAATVEGPPCFCFDHEPNRLTYVYSVPRVLTVWATARLGHPSANAVMRAEVRKNGEPIVGARATTQRGTVNTSGSVAIVANVAAVADDYFELWVTDAAGTQPITVIDFALAIRG
jgi:hypothetical protein